MNKIIITGATGSIGMALINKCIKEKTEMWIICRKNSPRRRWIPVNEYINIVEGDLDELESIDIPKDKYDAFYHLGWAGTFGEVRNNIEIQEKNIQYTLDAVKLAHRSGCRRFIGIGSQAEYGRADGALFPGMPEKPENGYGMAKLCAGQLSRLMCSQIGMEHIWIRVLSVYGPYDGSNTLISTVIRSLLEGTHVALTKGEQIWDYLYSEDAAEAIYRLGMKGKNGKIYILGSGEVRKLKDYVEIIKKILNGNDEIGYGDLPYSSEQVMHLEADISELTKDTGFVPQIDFEQGIKNTIKWIKNQ